MNKENKSGNARPLLPSAGLEALSDLNFCETQLREINVVGTFWYKCDGKSKLLQHVKNGMWHFDSVVHINPSIASSCFIEFRLILSRTSTGHGHTEISGWGGHIWKPTHKMYPNFVRMYFAIFPGISAISPQISAIKNGSHWVALKADAALLKSRGPHLAAGEINTVKSYMCSAQCSMDHCPAIPRLWHQSRAGIAMSIYATVVTAVGVTSSCINARTVSMTFWPPHHISCAWHSAEAFSVTFEALFMGSIVSGILSDILSGIYSDILSGRYSGILQYLTFYSGFLSGIYSDILLCHSIWHSFWHLQTEALVTLVTEFFWNHHIYNGTTPSQQGHSNNAKHHANA